jgi:hypothetical protein
MEAVVTAVAGVLLTAPAVVAYRHPAGFKILNRVFFTAMGLLIIAVSTWDFAGMRMAFTLHPYIDRAKLDAASAATDAATILNWKWYVGWIGATFIWASWSCCRRSGSLRPMRRKSRELQLRCLTSLKSPS